MSKIIEKIGISIPHFTKQYLENVSLASYFHEFVMERCVCMLCFLKLDVLPLFVVRRHSISRNKPQRVVQAS